MGWNIEDIDKFEGQKIMDSLSNIVKQVRLNHWKTYIFKILNYNAKYGDLDKQKMYKDNILGVKSTDEIFSLISVMIDDLVVNMNLNTKADKKTTEYAFLFTIEYQKRQQN